MDPLEPTHRILTHPIHACTCISITIAIIPTIYNIRNLYVYIIPTIFMLRKHQIILISKGGLGVEEGEGVWLLLIPNIISM